MNFTKLSHRHQNRAFLDSGVCVPVSVENQFRGTVRPALLPLGGLEVKVERRGYISCPGEPGYDLRIYSIIIFF